MSDDISFTDDSHEMSRLYCLKKSFCLCWGFTAQSTQWGHVEHGQFT